MYSLQSLVGPVGHSIYAYGEDRVERLPPAKDARRQQRKGDGLALLFLGPRHRVHVGRPQERVAPRQLVALAVRERVVIGTDGVNDSVASQGPEGPAGRDHRVARRAAPPVAALEARQRLALLREQVAARARDGSVDAAAALAALVRRVHQGADVRVQHAPLRHDELSIFQRVARERFQVVHEEGSSALRRRRVLAGRRFLCGLRVRGGGGRVLLLVRLGVLKAIARRDAVEEELFFRLGAVRTGLVRLGCVLHIRVRIVHCGALGSAHAKRVAVWAELGCDVSSATSIQSVRAVRPKTLLCLRSLLAR